MDDTKLYTYNIQKKICTNTSFTRNQTSIRFFTMAFVSNDNDTGETLYMGQINDGGYTLGKTNISSLTTSVVGNYTNVTSPDLTGTNDGRLFGFSYDTSVSFVQLNKTNAQSIVKYPTGLQFATFQSSAFAYYNSKFFLLLTDNNYTNISIYDPSTNITTLQKTMSPITLFNNAASTCLGT